MNTKPHAIVIADDHYNGLGVIRSLGENQVPVSLILLTQGKTQIDKSKYARKTVKLAPSAEAIVQAIRELSLEDAWNGVFPLSDFAAQVCDEYRGQLPENVIMPHTGGQMKRYQNKLEMSELAKACGFRIPEHMLVETDSQQHLQWDIYPAILKPAVSTEGAKADIVQVDDESQLQHGLRNYEKKGCPRVLLERYVAGTNAHMVEVLGYTDRNGQPHFSRVISKIREYPIQNGSTAYAKLVDSHPGLNFENLERMVRATGHYGLFDIEFKYADGVLYFIEMNFRNGAPAYALARTGFHLAWEWLYDAVGLPHCSRTKVTRKTLLMCEHRDVINMLKGEVNPAQWLAQFFRAQKLIWRWNDPVPSIMAYWEVLRQGVSRLQKK